MARSTNEHRRYILRVNRRRVNHPLRRRAHAWRGGVNLSELGI